MAILIVIVFGQAFTSLSVFNPIKRNFEDFSMTDLYFNIISNETDKKVNNNITIVDISDQFKRGEIANTISEIANQKPAIIVIDVIFEGIKDDMGGNDSLATAIINNKNVIVDMKLINYNEEENTFTSSITSFFHEYSNVPYGYGNIPDNMEKHTIREYTIFQNLNGKKVFSLSSCAACGFLKQRPDTTNSDLIAIDYTPTLFPEINHSKINENGNLIRDKIVMVGCLHEESDMHYTPLGKMSGTELQAYMIQTQLSHKKMSSMNLWASMLCGVLMCYLIVALQNIILRNSNNYSTLFIDLSNFFFMALWAWIGFYAYERYNYYINLLYPLLGIALASVGRHWYAIMESLYRDIKKLSLVFKHK
ncbi:MAG: CHASE2 domain-containing protein [Muribaculaceae bacterium]|jgi:CHASE2 domain-containing sensor protein|nr:CHASE2 domain-containing protein [Muribaculaceae bacterium]